MGNLTLVLPDDAYTVFRMLTIMLLGDKKGRLSYCGSDAIIKWCRECIIEYGLENEEPYKSFMETYFEFELI